MQHAEKGVYWNFQHFLGSTPSYCRYVYSRIGRREIGRSFECWNSTQIIGLGDNSMRSFKRVPITSLTTSVKGQWAKFTSKGILLIGGKGFLGGNIVGNLGLPKVGNRYGNRVFVLARNFGSEGRQSKTPGKILAATNNYSGFAFLKALANGDLGPVNVYSIVYNPEVLRESYKKVKSD